MLAKRQNNFKNNIFSDFFKDFDIYTTLDSEIVKAMAKEDEDKYIVNMEIPGIKKEDLDISIKDNYLIVKGSKEKSEEKTLFNEFHYGSFERFFKLPKNANIDDINAFTEDGVLKITIPKKAEDIPKTKKIEIK